MGKGSSNSSQKKISDADILAVFNDVDVPVLKTKEIAEREDVPIGPRQLETRLKSLQEQDRIGSRKVSASHRVRLWWNKEVELRQSWYSENDLTGTIGVEAVDVLEISGRSEKEKKRRRAVNAVFKYLFEKETGVASELKLVGWGADMDTYADSDSLWNNCINPALDESNFFQLYKTEKEWKLSQLGMWLKKKDEEALWNNWDSHEKNIINKFQKDFNWLINSRVRRYNHINTNKNARVSGYNQINTNEKYDLEFSLRIEADEPVWNNNKGTLFFITTISGDSDSLEDLFNNKSSRESKLDFDVTWVNKIDSQSEIFVYRSKQVEYNISSVFRQVELDKFTGQIKQLSDWVYNTKIQIKLMLNT